MNAKLDARIVAVNVHRGCSVSTARVAVALVRSHGAGSVADTDQASFVALLLRTGNFQCGRMKWHVYPPGFISR